MGEVKCPVERCSYENVPRSVAAHISGVHDDDHDWDRLGIHLDDLIDDGRDEEAVRDAQCVLCNTESASQFHKHHISYRPEETMMLCRRCHYMVHFVDGYHNDLAPKGTRKW